MLLIFKPGYIIWDGVGGKGWGKGSQERTLTDNNLCRSLIYLKIELCALVCQIFTQQRLKNIFLLNTSPTLVNKNKKDSGKKYVWVIKIRMLQATKYIKLGKNTPSRADIKYSQLVDFFFRGGGRRSDFGSTDN